MLNEQLQKQIEQEAEGYALMKVWINKSKNKSEEQLFFEYISATSFEAGATTYATRAITAEQENERLRKALEGIREHIIRCHKVLSNPNGMVMLPIIDDALTPKPTTNDAE